jgi:Flp pilus assembly protein TadB
MIPLLAALLTFIIGAMVLLLQDLRKQLPDARIRQRIEGEFGLEKEKSGRARKKKPEEVLFTIERPEEGMWARYVTPKLIRLSTVSGNNGLKIVIGVAVVVLLESIIASQLMPIPGWIRAISVVVEMPLAVAWTYKMLVERFRRRFLEAFPDAIDTILRAVRAGVPVTHVIGTVADESPMPLSREFRIMADSLQVGREITDVLDTATRRIGVADFSFFCVCLTLQRETGGQLGETLDNLANIVRTRREIRQKTKALTGEARITTKILISLPFAVMGGMYFLNNDYLMTLFTTEAGHKLLTVAAIAMILGVIVINKMSKLDTSR